jgi:hypothetical protein
VNNVNYLLGDGFRLCFVIEEPTVYINDSDLGFPDYYKDYIIDHTITKDFVGSTSNYTYTYFEDGYHGIGSYCLDVTFDPTTY